ncbi:hypothetical protein HNY73_004196 [Argiope bruennichi]|uniref:Uncharacterized protein n=1 Tax=Argiope bruennichi TaxID=94029 RepID=A0A8T0FN61_ARGBR|nr:hypothetical protein HNY73_004196 [Argiope bruennichi]
MPSVRIVSFCGMGNVWRVWKLACCAVREQCVGASVEIGLAVRCGQCVASVEIGCLCGAGNVCGECGNWLLCGAGNVWRVWKLACCAERAMCGECGNWIAVPYGQCVESVEIGLLCGTGNVWRVREMACRLVVWEIRESFVDPPSLAEFTHPTSTINRHGIQSVQVKIVHI